MKTKKNSFGRRTSLVAFTLFISLALGCKGNPTAADDSSKNDGNNTPRTSVPAQLVNTWKTGTVSTIDFYNPTTGTWGAPSGVGMFFKFTPDGYYEKGVLLQSSWYGCTMTFFAYNKGTMTVEGDTIVLYPSYGKIKSIDNCVAENNYEKPDQLKSETLLWEHGQDEYGVETLWLRAPDNGPSAFHHE